MADVWNKQQILDEVHDEKNALGQEVDGILVHWRDLRTEIKHAIEADVDWAERLIKDRSGRIMQVIFPRQGQPVTDNPVNPDQPPADTTSTPQGSTPAADGSEPTPGDPNAGVAVGTATTPVSPVEGDNPDDTETSDVQTTEGDTPVEHQE